MARGRHPTRIHIDPPTPQVAEKYLRYWYGGDIIHQPERFPGLTSPDLFENNNPLEIDFGCGTGVHVCNRAAQNPGINLLGIDVSQKPLFCGINDAHTRGIDNVKFVRSNFNALLPLLKPESVHTAYYLFPNPPHDYFHQRANEGRKRFLEKVYSSLVRNGRFVFATDCEPFFECLHKIVTEELHYTTCPLDIDSEGISTWYRSIWETRGICLRGFVVEKS
ncbi:MAG TPA: methyltransferase domain-containing protein [Chitinispirillaceae bacterium]|nr:methyltransferase domain-containing protein [Chitinispirillaceae bacterium]